MIFYDFIRPHQTLKGKTPAQVARIDAANGQNKWQEGILSWLGTQTDPRYHPPTDYCGTQNPVNVEFFTPKDKTSNLPNKFSIEVRADSTSEVTQVELYVDGTRIRTFNSKPFKEDATLENGVHTLRAVAKDANGKESDRGITIGVNTAWDYSPTLPPPSPTPTP